MLVISGASERRFYFLYVFTTASGLVTAAYLALVTRVVAIFFKTLMYRVTGAMHHDLVDIQNSKKIYLMCVCLIYGNTPEAPVLHPSGSSSYS